MPGIGVVVNPHARGEPRTARASARAAHGRHRRPRRRRARHAESLDAIEEVAREFRDRGIDDPRHLRRRRQLPLHADRPSTASTATQPLPLLLPLRAGTINYIADAIGGRRGTPEQVLARVVRDYRRGRTHETTERDVLRVNGARASASC